MVWALSEINSNVETDGKDFPTAFGFALDLGFNILPEHFLLLLEFDVEFFSRSWTSYL